MDDVDVAEGRRGSVCAFGRGRGLAAAAAVAALTVAGMPVAAAEGSVDGSDLQSTVAESEIEPATLDFDDTLRHLQWNLDRIGMPAAWAFTTGDPDVTIAVIDTGVDDRHQDFDGAMWRDPVSQAFGFNHVDGSFETFTTRDADWHGTAVAGIAVARAGDGFGIAGIAPDVGLMVHRVYESSAYGLPPTQTSYTNGVRAIRDATAAGADVILVTWGGTALSNELLSAIRDAGVPVVAAAGNDGQDLSNSPTVQRYPAMYQLPNLVTVAAADENDRISTVAGAPSNYGVRHVDIAAPGEDIISVSASARHDRFDGTSFAAPHVAGALALGRSVAPDASTTELIAALLRTARPTPDLADKVISGGMLDVAAFLRSVDRPACGGGLPETDFTDLTRDSVHIGNVDCVVFYRVALGIDDDRFAPRRTITRGEMASFLARMLETAGYDITSAPASGFADVAGTTHEAAIDVVAAAGIAQGTGGDRFEPSRLVTRAQMATFVVGAVEVLLDRELTSTRTWFDDVAGNTHERGILIARELEITFGTVDPRTYQPNRDMTREQMASFVARTLDALGRQGIEVAPRA